MAPTMSGAEASWRRTDAQRGTSKSALTVQGDILEAWGEGYQVGSLVILLLIVVCNYRRRVMLHKLILLEMFLAIWHGTFIFLDDPTYGWYLSATALLLFISYQVHNVVAYLKIRPFMPRWGQLAFIISLALVQPYWIIEAWDNFEYFNGSITWNVYTRPWEALFRDPWWIFTTCYLLYKIKSQYEFTLRGLFQTSPRLVIMILCMFLSIAFLLADVVVTAAKLTQDAGINPYWRLALVFKAASDTIFLDDFKSVLDSITAKRFSEFKMDDNGRRNAHCGPSGASGASMSTQRPVSPTNTSMPLHQTRQQQSLLQGAGTIGSGGSAPNGSGHRHSESLGEKSSLPGGRGRQNADPLWAELGYGHGSTLPRSPSSQHLERVPSSDLATGGDTGLEQFPRLPIKTLSPPYEQKRKI